MKYLIFLLFPIISYAGTFTDHCGNNEECAITQTIVNNNGSQPFQKRDSTIPYSEMQERNRILNMIYHKEMYVENTTVKYVLKDLINRINDY